MSLIQQITIKLLLKIIFICSWLYFTFLMIGITFAYFPFSSEAAFLAIKQDEVNNITGYLSIFYIHVIFSIFVLITGIIQILPIHKIIPKTLHRISGYLYVVLVLLFSAPSGLFIGYYANGGFLAILAFEILGVLWMFFTTRAMFRLKSKNYRGHQYDMWRSYALALSALTLRLWKVIIVYLFQPNPMESYIIVAWLGWIINLILIEIYINHHKKTIL